MLSLAVTVAARPRPAESSRRPSLCASRNVTAKELPPLLFQESGHYEPQWIPRLGFESSDRLVPSRTTARNSSEWLRSLVQSRRALIKQAATMGLSLTLASTSDLARQPQSSLRSDKSIDARLQWASEAVARGGEPMGVSSLARRVRRGFARSGQRAAFCAVLDDTSAVEAAAGTTGPPEVRLRHGVAQDRARAHGNGRREWRPAAQQVARRVVRALNGDFRSQAQSHGSRVQY